MRIRHTIAFHLGDGYFIGGCKYPSNLPVYVPLGLLQIADGIVLIIMPPEILNGAPYVEVKMFGNIDAFHTRGVRRVMRWVVDQVCHGFSLWVFGPSKFVCPDGFITETPAKPTSGAGDGGT